MACSASRRYPTKQPATFWRALQKGMPRNHLAFPPAGQLTSYVQAPDGVLTASSPPLIDPTFSSVVQAALPPLTQPPGGLSPAPPARPGCAAPKGSRRSPPGHCTEAAGAGAADAAPAVAEAPGCAAAAQGAGSRVGRPGVPVPCLSAGPTLVKQEAVLEWPVHAGQPRQASWPMLACLPGNHRCTAGLSSTADCTGVMTCAASRPVAGLLQL